MDGQWEHNLAWEPLVEDGQRACLNNRFHEAEFLYKKALAMAMHEKCVPHTSVAKLFFLLGDFYSEQQQYEFSETFFRSALAVLASAPENSPIDTAITLKSLSEVYRAQSRDAEAHDFAQRAKLLVSDTVRHLELLFRKRAARA